MDPSINPSICRGSPVNCSDASKTICKKIEKKLSRKRQFFQRIKGKKTSKNYSHQYKTQKTQQMSTTIDDNNNTLTQTAMETSENDILRRLFTRVDTCDPVFRMVIDRVRERYRDMMKADHKRLCDTITGCKDNLVYTVIVLAAFVNEPDIRQSIIDMCHSKEKATAFADWVSLPLKSLLQRPITPANAEETFAAFAVSCSNMWMTKSAENMVAEMDSATKKDELVPPKV